MPVGIRKLFSVGVVTVCVLIGGLVLASSPALAAPEAPTIVPESESVTEVTATSAKLRAQVDPGGAETTYHFEYGTTTAYGQSTPESASIGSDNSEYPAAAPIQELQPGTSYHYRIVATNSQSPTGGTPGPDETFTTQPVGGGFTLPDGRAYELVSPAQKDGAEIVGIGGGGTTPAGGDATQASEDGTSITYLASAPVGANPPGNTLSTQIFSTRGADGWSSQDIATPHKNAIGPNHILNEGEEYVRFSSDLSRAVLRPLHTTPEPPLAPEVHQQVSGETEIYLRNDATGVFQALVATEPLPELTPSNELPVAFEGATPDLSHVVFEGPAGLDPRYPGAGGTYEWSDGHTGLVDVLPTTGQPASGASLLASDSRNSFGYVLASATRYAVSSDGARVVWSGEGDLFTRDMATGETVQVDAAQGGAGPGGGGVFQAASSDGSRVFFTDTTELTSGAPEGGLFMFDVETGKLTDLTPDATTGGFFQANNEGTSLYEVSSAVLSSAANSQGEVAKGGASNLYLLREAPAESGSWSATFITAGMEEGFSEGSLSAGAPLAVQAARVSPDERYLAFMSQQSLTGYDNRDANSGQPDEEVYLYDAQANRLVCASCNPTGARPIGEHDEQEADQASGIQMDPWNIWEGHWLAATIPGWTPDGHDLSTGYQPRYLSDSGRLFFDSADALVPQDVNEREDVYEYEPAGEGSCQPPSYGQSASDVFNESADGCVGLLSAGTGSGDSVFFDASASGNDVFFTTQDGLVPQDTDGVSDMYDARVCTQAEPCPSSPAVSPPCTTPDSCRAAPTPQPPIFGSGPTETFTGAGNPAPPPPTVTKKASKKKVKCPKGKTRNKHGQCVKTKKKNNNKRSNHGKGSK